MKANYLFKMSSFIKMSLVLLFLVVFIFRHYQAWIDVEICWNFTASYVTFYHLKWSEQHNLCILKPFNNLTIEGEDLCCALSLFTCYRHVCNTKNVFVDFLNFTKMWGPHTNLSPLGSGVWRLSVRKKTDKKNIIN